MGIVIRPATREHWSDLAALFGARGACGGCWCMFWRQTGADFAACFFGAVYAGAWPVPLPLPTSFGGREAYVDQLSIQLKSSDPRLFLYPRELADFCAGGAERAGVPSRDWQSFTEVAPPPAL